MQPMFAEVALFLPIRSTFHYRIPTPLQSKIQPGCRVRVPFGSRQLLGMMVGFVQKPEVRFVKPIADLLDEQPLLEADLLKLTRWIGRFTLSGWGEAIAAALPSVFRRGLKKMEPRLQEESGSAVPTQPLRLNAEQQRAIHALLPAIQKPFHRVFLLHGITASGKTEIYLQAIQEVLNQGRSSIVLVPEISLTPQAIERFQGRFGESQVAVLHSGMRESRRFKEWERIRSGEARVVVGARSAVFAPVQRIGLIVVDEEHEPSYKQEDPPRYHAREVAIQRGTLSHTPVLLGSATPSIETYYAAASKPARMELLCLAQRIEEVPLPGVEIVDMRREETSGRRNRIFSRLLEEALAQTLEDRQQAILFLNRRGFSTFIHCPRCGHVLKCKSCQLPQTYHMATKSLTCHHCHGQAELPELCPQCRSQYVRFHGIGTERVESELARFFPQAKLARMDSDATQAKGSHAKILDRFSRHETDILIGTQMIAKGLDFPKVTLVGAISADTALNLPDFRSAERTFQLLTQVAGRAGRGKLPGRVIVQTHTPHHYAIRAAQNHDYLSFYEQELAIRRQLQLPPFTHLVRLTVRSARSAKAVEFSEKLAEICRRLEQKIQVLGPAPAPIPRLRGQHRWQILLKLASLDLFQERFAEILERHRPPLGCRLAVDVDPL